MRRCPYCHHALDHVEVVRTDTFNNAVFSILLGALIAFPFFWWLLGHVLLGAAAGGAAGIAAFYLSQATGV